jgi:hypothetical protein
MIFCCSLIRARCEDQVVSGSRDFARGPDRYATCDGWDIYLITLRRALGSSLVTALLRELLARKMLQNQNKIGFVLFSIPQF